ncbi:MULTISPECIES: ABC transporter ATP-binding protein [Corynebacterium]|uniref:ABC transporter ATP-binding protein n=1 Tax=Corynebacterium phoceense TaxID=1686286 RepID=A0A540R838_9CORY|nr:MULTISPECIES: ABC transporter ATP-binding protein [Corynebacterium]KXB52617.1 ABC transporter, ATP-binding protein [Corynebacterium sp. DNF00584]OFL79292.1 ABC transporter ATP-binding protein [Corynebacterium sp. HMSC077B05]TQE43906.1 ABC transporter ATP-binding protein [Corynebacterium phoceense]
MLSLNDVSVIFPDGDHTLTALDSASLTVNPGQLAAITGESGSGKSTLLNVAAGLIAPTSGSIQVAGHELAGLDDETRARVRRENIGMVFQQPNLLGSLTAREQLLIVDHLRGVRPRKDRADELLSFVGLADLGHRRMERLSGGQRQRVNIARALMADPAVLLCDEPTSALDSQLTSEVVDLLRRATAEWDTATVVVTHDLSVAAAADAHWEVRDGHVGLLSRAA